MNATLPSLNRSRRALPPHGYEGRRAEARFVPPVLPTPAPISLPSAEELVRRGFTFEPVGLTTGGPVRLRLQGRPMGVFITREAASSTINRFST